MKDAAPKIIAVSKALEEVMFNDRGRLLAGLVSRLGDLQNAEDALQEASISALRHWSRSGIPHAPMAWLMKVALNKGLDRFRTETRETRKVRDLNEILPQGREDVALEDIPDERLGLIFACCHPALEEKSRVALTLRTVCNLTTREIANAFLDTETTMGQRISRAKSKIKAKGIPFAVPDSSALSDRLETVLTTLYLIFTAGYISQDVGKRDLCKEAIFLAQLLNQLTPENPEIEGLLALLLLTNARRRARVSEDGASLPVSEQNRTQWDRNFIVEGQILLATAMARRAPGPFQIKAAIADCYMVDPSPDWPQISLLYQSLWYYEPTPVVELNWAVVLSELGQTEVALEKLEDLRGDLSEFQPWSAARADILTKLGRVDEAVVEYERAIRNAPNPQDAAFLEKRLAQVRMLNG